MKELDDIDLLDEEVRRSGKWQPFEYEELGSGTDKAIMIDDKWVPKSQLRLDENYKLWMSTWWYDKKFTFTVED